MKHVIKIVAVLLLVSMLFGLLTACNPKEPENPVETHVCHHVCETCGKCTDATCTNAVCAEKCAGHSGPTGEHACQHVCPLCVKCTDASCTNAACSKKCAGHSDFVDVAATLKLDLGSSSKKIVDAKVRTMNGNVIGYIDGDTTHFTCDTSINEDGVLKARYLGINTPESTGTIEQYGKTASNFTKNTLKGAQSIVIESEDDKWNKDSNGRNLVWIWYRNSATEDYRCLNIELLQRGLAIASNSANNKYGEYCVAAINAAKDGKYNVYSGIKDPNFYDGSAIKLTLKEIRANPSAYLDKLVAVEGVISYGASETIFLEEYDEESYMNIGISVYYGFGASGGLLSILKIGNRVRIVGKVQYYEAGGTYQISGLEYNARKANDPDYCGLISKGSAPAFQEISASDFKNGKRTITYVVGTGEEQQELSKEFNFAELALSTSVSLKDLRVVDVYTTKTGTSKGAMTLTCQDANGVQIDIRTDVLTRNGTVITADEYLNKTIDVRGIVDFYDGSYQVKVYSAESITVKN